MKIQNFDEGAKLRDILMEYRIVTDAGMRFGTAELTRLRFHEKEIQTLGNIIGQIFHHSFKSQPFKPEEINIINEEIDILINIAKESDLLG